MNEARVRLLEIFAGDGVCWQDDALIGGGRLKRREGPVEHLKKHNDGRLTFSCCDWNSTIEADDRVEISGQCVATYRTAGSGRQWLSVYAPIVARDEVADVMRSRMRSCTGL